MFVCLTIISPPIIYMTICLSIWLFIHLSIIYSCLSVCLSIYLTIHLFACLSKYLTMCLSFWLSIRLSVWLSIRISVWLSIRLSVCLSIWLSICLPDYLSIYGSSSLLYISLRAEPNGRSWTRPSLSLRPLFPLPPSRASGGAQGTGNSVGRKPSSSLPTRRSKS